MKPKWILIAEDDDKDADLTLHALLPERSQSRAGVIVVHDGSEALDCLYHRNNFQFRDDDDDPAFVLLDLKMPRVDGRGVLRQIKSDARLKLIPVVVFTSSREETDVAQCYHLGANAYVVKPVDFNKFVETVREIRDFWLECNELPMNGANGSDAAVPQLTLTS